MAKKKYYAVKNGRKIGIYESWDECRKQTDGFADAQFQSFASREEAVAYLNGTQGDEIPQDVLCAFVDGSFDVASNRYGSGMVLLFGGEEKTFFRAGEHPSLVSMRNVAGEITASVMAMRYAVTNGFSELVIYHDYEGIAKWCTGEWKANTEGTKRYRAFCDSVRDRLTVRFVKVAAHTGNHYNEMADQLAKRAIGIL